MTAKRKKIHLQLPWLIVVGLALMLILLMPIGWWRSSGVGPQIQVPMFYDAHYLFPRAWTQDQSAPGVPGPTPVAFFGPNRISQAFVSGSDRLSMVELWLAGDENQKVSVSLADDHGEFVAGEILLTAGDAGGRYRLSFEPYLKAKEHEFTLTMTAPDATIDRPVVTRTVGGDRLGGSLLLNEYNRPGNLALTAYATGLPGIWWLEAVGEQMVPLAFRLRLQQYKPTMFKGLVFPFLLLITAALSILYLVLARPQVNTSSGQLSQALGWTLALIMILFILWQAADGRVKVRPILNSIPLDRSEPFVDKAPPPGSASRLVNDLAADLWTADRYPEERFVSSELVDGLPAIRVPADSRLEYRIDVPPNAWFRTGMVGSGQGELLAEVSVGAESVLLEELTATAKPEAADVQWFEFDLAKWTGQSVTLILATEGKNDELDGLWIMPQIESDSDWLLADTLAPKQAIEAAAVHFADTVELVGYRVEPFLPSREESATVTLYWRPLQETSTYAKVYIHLLDQQGQLVAQHDAQPVNNTYPFPVWQPGTTIIDEHVLELPADMPDGVYTIAVGIYDPDSLQRWTVTNPAGLTYQEDRFILSSTIEVSP